MPTKIILGPLMIEYKQFKPNITPYNDNSHCGFHKGESCLNWLWLNDLVDSMDPVKNKYQINREGQVAVETCGYICYH